MNIIAKFVSNLRPRSTEYSACTFRAAQARVSLVMKDVMLEPIDYATPELDRKQATTDFIPLALGVIQLLVSLLALIGPIDGFASFSRYWYEWPAQLWLSANCSVFIYICGVAAVLRGATTLGDQRRRWYRICAGIWIGSVILTEFSMAILCPWPGERRFRWIMIHNLRCSALEPADFWGYPVTSLLINPALWFLAGRSIVRRLR